MFPAGKRNQSEAMGRQAIIETLNAYFRTQPVLRAWLFGSFSRGEDTPESDVDILVTLDRAKPVGLKFFGMRSDIEELLGRRVDLVPDTALQPSALPSVNRDKILVYERR